MNGRFITAITKLFKTRDELSLSNIRKTLLPVLLVFPLSVIVGDLRYFDLKITFIGLESYQLMLYSLGLGWLVLVFTPGKFIIHLLRIAALCSALLLPFQLLLADDMGRLAVFIAFQFFNGICAASAFSLFCFNLNNVERLFGMSIIMFYYGFYYTVWRAFPIVQSIGKTWGGSIAVILYLAIVFFLSKVKHEEPDTADITSTAAGKNLLSADTLSMDADTGSFLVIGLHLVYYTIMSMINYIEWSEKIVYSLPYGLGQFASIIVVILIMLIINHSALHIWVMYLVFSLFGLTILIYDSSLVHFLGSLVYGLGDGLGYIIIYYLCSGVIKRSHSIKMYKLFCLIFFIEYFIISGILSFAFKRYAGSNHYVALGIVLVLCSACFLLLPVMQKKLFKRDWTDGLHLHDIAEYTRHLAETEEINIKDRLNLTTREHELFTLLLKGLAPKEIAFTLKISYHTINFHRSNLYRKLGIQSRSELFARFKIENI